MMTRCAPPFKKKSNGPLLLNFSLFDSHLPALKDRLTMASSNDKVANTSQTIISHPRHAYAKSILGEDLFTQLANCKVLVVGAGGIGCELLKNLALIGIGDIEVIDLDTIDLSNLNRQFLFTKAHISKPKSLIASSTAIQFNPLVHIKPYHANVKDTNQFGWEFFEKFDVVCNALDNLDARRWVNRMCIMTGTPLVESGTTGFLGQVQPIMKVSRRRKKRKRSTVAQRKDACPCRE